MVHPFHFPKKLEKGSRFIDRLNHSFRVPLLVPSIGRIVQYML